MSRPGSILLSGDARCPPKSSWRGLAPRRLSSTTGTRLTNSNGIDCTGRDMAFEQKEVFPNGIPIARDGFGNFWVLDLTPQTAKTAPVFFACHDAPVILYQSSDIASFLTEVFRMSTPPHKSLVDDVHEDRLFDVWRKNPGVMDQPAAAASPDSALRAFASALPGHFQVVDLRTASPGMGFSWGRYGPRTEVRRHG
jgi:hypothetical protein